MVAVDIANLALSYLGDTATVASLDPPEGSAQAQHCARFYPVALSVMLDGHQWNFVTKRAALALVGNYTPPDGRWKYAYALPSDVANVISVLPGCLYPTPDEVAFAVAIASYWGLMPLEWEHHAGDYQLEVVNGQTAIVSNAQDAVLRYSCNTVQPGQFSALFTDALARRLASMLAGPLLKGDAGAKEGARQLQMHQMILQQAKESDANQRHGNYKPVPSSIAARQ